MANNTFPWNPAPWSVILAHFKYEYHNPCIKSKVHVWKNQCVFPNLFMSWCIKNHLKARKAKQRRLRVNIFNIKCMFTYFPKHAVRSCFSLLFSLWIYLFKGGTEMHAFNCGIKNIAARQILFIKSSIHILSLSLPFTQTLKLFSQRLQKPSHLSAQVYMAKRI